MNTSGKPLSQSAIKARSPSRPFRTVPKARTDCQCKAKYLLIAASVTSQERECQVWSVDSITNLGQSRVLGPGGGRASLPAQLLLCAGGSGQPHGSQPVISTRSATS